MKISKEDAAGLKWRSVNPQPNGKTFTLMVNGAILLGFNTKNAVAADYLSFIDGVTTALLNDTEQLEKEANMSEKTIKHAKFETLGSLPITATKDL